MRRTFHIALSILLLSALVVEETGGASAQTTTCSQDGEPVVYSRPGNGSFYHSTFGPYRAGEGFVAQGTSITRIATWMTVPTEAPIRAEIVEGSDFNGPVVGVVELPSGATGKVETELPSPIHVTPGGQYILRVSSPDSTQGRIEQQDNIDGVDGYYDGGGRSPLNMALEVTYCGSALTTSTRPPTDADFGPVHGSAVAGQSFLAGDSALANASVWLREANNGPLTVGVRRGDINGTLVGSARLMAGTAGKRTISFAPAVRLQVGTEYVLTVGADGANTTTGVLARGDQDPDSQGYTEAGPTNLDLALQLDFSDRQGTGDLTTADCTSELRLEPDYVESVNAALRSGPDVWGRELTSRPEGPTYGNIKDYLKPLMLVGQPAGTSGTRLTDSGVYYLPMGTPGGAEGSGGPMALHVADGSQVISTSAGGRKTTVYVGVAGHERYGLCLASLAEPELDDGYLPVLSTRYRDVDGVGYHQVSFVAPLPGQEALASYVRISVERGDSGAEAVQLRTTMSDSGLQRMGDRLVRDGRTYLLFSTGADYQSGHLRFSVDLTDNQPDVAYLVRPIDPVDLSDVTLGEDLFEAARSASNVAWRQRLSDGARYEVPEKIVMDAQRNLLLQNLQLGWRYSWGNAYESHFPEGNHAQVTMATYGFQADARSGLQTLLGLTHNRSLHWERGAKLLAAAEYFLQTGDRDYILANTPALERYVADLARERAGDPNGLLPKDELSHDITTKMYGTHVQAMAWRGMRDMATVWALVGREDLAERYHAEAEAFGAALRAAIDRSAIKVTENQTFIPVALLSDEQPWSPITDTKLGSYWNLVMPYVYASGIFKPNSQLAAEVLEFARQHGSFLLGLQRFNYYPTPIGSVTPDGLPGYKTSGADNLYGVERTEFLADMDSPDDLVLALYGKLAHGMTRGTFISGEGDTIGPVEGEYFRSMYLPPSSFNNDFFLTVLREMLVHTTTDGAGRPHGLHLAFSTPRGWLEHGKRIAVAEAPTPFGELAYTIGSHVNDGYLDVDVRVPEQRVISDLHLRLRLPAGLTIDRAELQTAAHRVVPVQGETLNLTGMSGHVRLRVYLSDR